jgi:SagB-type dehydrogenase family enzyme
MFNGLLEPRPRANLGTYVPYRWNSAGRTRLDAGPQAFPADMAMLSRERQTRRQFAAVSLKKIGDLLWLACRVHTTQPSEFGFDQEFRPLPSAGAVHPIHVLMQRDRGTPWEVYDPSLHELVGVYGSLQLAQASRGLADKIVQSGNSTLVALVAEPGKTGAKYVNPESLVWRDAGVMLGYLSLFGEALGMNVCPLGTSGDPFLAQLAEDGSLFGAGMVLIGARPDGP